MSKRDGVRGIAREADDAGADRTLDREAVDERSRLFGVGMTRRDG